jgi:DNA-binding MarR family transcriptional regulator
LNRQVNGTVPYHSVMPRRNQPADAEAVRWLTTDEELAYRSIGNLMHKLHWALECQLERDSGLSFIEYYTLARLSEEPDHRLRMSDLAAAANASLSRLSHLVKRLESWGFVRREPDANDGRYTIAILTENGYAKLVESAPAHVHCVRELVIDQFRSAELKQLQSLCDRIVAGIDASEWKQEPT